MATQARGYEKWDWKGEASETWRCSECNATVEEATHKHSGKGRRQANPYNEHQVTCSPRCARARKVRLQAERRQQARENRRAREEQARDRSRRQAPPPPPPPPRSSRPTDEGDAAILGIPWGAEIGAGPGGLIDLAISRSALKAAWRAKIAAVHPDHHGSATTDQAKNVNAAYQRMRERRGW